MNFKEVVKATSGKGLVIALLGFLIPFLAGVAIGVVFRLELMRTIFLGLCISITALPVAVRILESFKMLQSDIANYSIAAAILNDVAALLINRELFLVSRYSDLEKTLASVTGGFLAPLFFACLGLEFNLLQMGSPLFVAIVLLVAIASKLLAGWLGGRLIRLPQRDALGIGIILNGRGVMELVIASIALQHGLIGEGLFSTLILMGVVTTILTPVLFRKFVQPAEHASSDT